MTEDRAKINRVRELLDEAQRKSNLHRSEHLIWARTADRYARELADLEGWTEFRSQP